MLSVKVNCADFRAGDSAQKRHVSHAWAWWLGPLRRANAMYLPDHYVDEI